MSKWGIVDKSLEGRAAVYFPHHHEVPRDPGVNRRYRAAMHVTPRMETRDRIRAKCKEDFLYYLMSFVNIFQAKGDPKPVPFIPYDFQIECFTVLWKCMHDGQEDCRLNKPRDMGATWMILCLFEHTWHWMSQRHLLLGSRREAELDGAAFGSVASPSTTTSPAGEWSKLLTKLDFIHMHQPKWIWPRGYVPRKQPYRTKLRIVNPATGSLIVGESANRDFGRSGRYYAVGFDEHAHTERAYEIIASCSQTSDCHLWWSSPAGPGTAFAMLGRSQIRQIQLKWWMHPLHAREMTLNESLGDKGRSSPWLVKEMNRIGNDPVLANSEIWANESYVSGSYYIQALFDLLLGPAGSKDDEVPTFRGTVRPPTHRGELDVRIDTTGPWPTNWLPQPEGQWQLWLNFDSEGRPPSDDRYIMGVDVATGTVDAYGRGSSNSTIAVISEYSRAKVATYATHGLVPHKFAAVVAAAARWFSGMDRHAYIIWDAGGPGGTMGDTIVGDYGMSDNVYLRPASRGTRGPMPGYVRPGNNEEARKPWGSHERMLWEREYTERCYDTVVEMQSYHHNPNGGPPVHIGSSMIGRRAGAADPSGARENHGDRMVATILACIELAKRKNQPKQPERIVPFGSVLHMRQLQQKRDLKRMLI